MRRTLATVAILALIALALVALPQRSRAAGGEIQGAIPAAGGIAAVVWGGGPVDQLVSASAAKGCNATSVWAFPGGVATGYVVGAPAFVSAAFGAAFPGDIPAGTILILLCTPTSSPAPTATATSTPTPVAGIACGEERWPVKTLSDADAGSVNFTPVDTTVSQLRALTEPPSLPADARIAPVELTTYRVTADVVEFKIEDDQDIHLVIADPSDLAATMIVEFPNADVCSGAVTSAEAGQMRASRAALVAEFGMPSTSSFKFISGTVTLTGVAFFDFLHGQTGVAPNGIELHPVLSVTMGGVTPSPTATSTAAVTSVAFVTVNGAPPGGQASATVQTTASAACSLRYVTPSGTVSSASGLEAATADATGRASWSWSIGPSTNPGTGALTATCDGVSATSPITIG